MARGESDDVLIVGVEENDPECFCVGVTTGKAAKKRHGRNDKGKTPACILGKRWARTSLSTADMPIVLDGDETACQLLDVVATGRRSLDSPTKPRGEHAREISRVDVTEVDWVPLPEKASVSPCIVKSCSDTQTTAGTDVSDEQGLPCEKDGPTKRVPTSCFPAEQANPRASSSTLSSPSTSAPASRQDAASGRSSGTSGADLQPSTSNSGPTSLSHNYIESDYQIALQLSADSNLGGSSLDAVSLLDAELARSLQAEEYKLAEGSLTLTGVEPGKTKKRKRESLSQSDSAPQAPAFSSAPTTSKLPATSQLSSPSLTDSSSSNEETLMHTDTDTDAPTSTATQQPLHTYPHPPTWTPCPNCPPGLQRRYHLIAVTMFSDEWERVSRPLSAAGYTVTSMKRIQNETLWQRLQSECQLMLRGRHEGYDLNERLLYHTSRADKSVICEEGLDQRLSRCGNFGNGIYFR